MSEEFFAKRISLRQDEEMIAILHHHPLTYSKQIAITLVLIIAAFFLMFFLVSQGPIGVAIFLALLGTGAVYGAREFYGWYANVYVITSQRIIDIDQRGFFNKTVSEVAYNKISDVCYVVKGVFQTVLHLGTIKISASGIKLLLTNVKDVNDINQLITDLIRENTGKEIEVKEVKQLNGEGKEKLTEEFLKQEELDEYSEYNLKELIEEYKTSFGEVSLKKLLADTMDKYELAQKKSAESQPTEQQEDDEEAE